MRKSKAIKLLEFMRDKKEGVSYSEMQQFFYDIKHNDNKKCPRGYYCVGITQLNDNGMFKYKNKKYFISKLAEEGLKNGTLKPYARFQTLEQELKYLKNESKRWYENYLEMKRKKDDEYFKYNNFKYSKYTKEDGYRMKVGTLINRLMSLNPEDYVDISMDPEGNAFGDITDFGHEKYSIFKSKFKDGKTVWSLIPRDNEQPEDRYKEE
jgi:hypothetical protein